MSGAKEVGGNRVRTSSAAEKVRESIDRLRTLELDEVDKDLYELSLKNEAKAAAEVQANLALASATPADDDAITAAIQEVEDELKREANKKQFEQIFFGVAVSGVILGAFALRVETRGQFRQLCNVWLDFVFSHVDKLLDTFSQLLKRE